MITELRKYPFVRILFPLVAGILITDHLFFKGVTIPLTYLLATLFVAFAGLLAIYKIRQYPLRWIFGFTLYLFLFLVGSMLTTVKLAGNSFSFHPEKQVYKAVVKSNPEKRANSILYSAMLDDKQNILLYFFPDSAVQNISCGDEMLIYAQPSLPENKGNPDEFNYPRYLLRKGICGTAYVQSGNWKLASKSTSISWQEIAFNCRDYVIGKYKIWGFSGDELAVLSALTVGYKEELSEEIRESFSVSGASHVLALSGLHVGLLFGLLFYLFKKTLGNSKSARILRALLTILLLWCFAFITGFSPSVVRSVCMFSLLALSQITEGKILSIHTLSVAAFFMLVYNPLWIFDVGFQLSFVAVLGIVIIQPRLYKLIQVYNPVFSYFWGIITVSVAAQIATAPLVIFYFTRFSTHFLLTNLWVVLLVTVIVYGAVLMIIVSPFVWLSQTVAHFLNFLVKTLNASVGWVEKLPYASIDHIWLHHWEVILFYLALLVFICFMVCFKKVYAFTFVACMLLMVSHRLWVNISDPPAPAIVFYNVRNCPVVHCIHTNGNSWLVCADSVPDTKRLAKTVSGYWNRRGLAAPQPVIADINNDDILRVDNFVLFKGKRIYLLNNSSWDNKSSACPLSVDYLFVSRGFAGNLEAVSNLLSPTCIVFDSSIPLFRLEALKSACVNMKIEYVLLNEEALIVEL